MKEFDPLIRKKIINIISALIPETKIYLFGSRARGKHSQHSDIDIALDAGKPLPIVLVDELKSIFEATNIMYKIEVVDFYRVSDAMRDSILKERIIWKS
jgi:predicted nucleotidyltransferase